MYIGRYSYRYIIIPPQWTKYLKGIMSIIEQEKYVQLDRGTFLRSRVLGNIISTSLSSPHLSLKNKMNIVMGMTPRSLVLLIRCQDFPGDYFGDGVLEFRGNTLIEKLNDSIEDYCSNMHGSNKTTTRMWRCDNSFNEHHTDYMLKCIRTSRGLDALYPNPKYMWASSAFRFNKMTVTKIKIADISARIFYKKGRGKTKVIEVPVAETPHTKGLTDDIKYYAEYVDQFLFRVFRNNTMAADDFVSFSKTLNYLALPYSNQYITTKKKPNGQHLLMDGNHRVAVLYSRGVKEVIAAVDDD